MASYFAQKEHQITFNFL